MATVSDLFSHCYVNKNDNEDRFVGVKAEGDNITVYFPIGYELPKKEQDLRQDILHLFSVLAEFTSHDEGILPKNKFEDSQPANFPINAYLEIINYFMEQNGYYTEKEPEYRTNDRGKIAWSRTIKRQRPLIQANGSPIYTKYTVRFSSPNDKNLITQIHKYCVYESFSKLGWLFTPYLPEKPLLQRDEKLFLLALYDKMANTYNDKDKRLFSAMISILKYLDERPKHKQFYFGTNRFEYIWEKLIDRVFGIKEKQYFFPKTRWILRTGKKKVNATLEPDTIMLYNGKIYVLDAKYYHFGITGDPKDLPESSSINKQITYGEYIYTQQKFKEKYGDDVPVYNAFIMPYNANDNLFNSKEVFLNIGEATGDWKSNGHMYEKVQGILVDIRYLMHHYIGNTENQIMQLAKSIESAFKQSKGVLPAEIL